MLTPGHEHLLRDPQNGTPGKYQLGIVPLEFKEHKQLNEGLSAVVGRPHSRYIWVLPARILGSSPTPGQFAAQVTILSSPR